MTQQLFLLGDVSKMLGVQPYRITYLLQTGKVPEPNVRLGSRRMFTPEDVSRIAQHFEANMNNNKDAKGERKTSWSATTTKRKMN